jgi:hypothetical protein
MEISRDSGFASGKKRSDALHGPETFHTPGTALHSVVRTSTRYLNHGNVQKLREIIEKLSRAAELRSKEYRFTQQNFF